jgi:ankyrin repeat protein
MFEHGMQTEMIIHKDNQLKPLHLAAKSGANRALISLISRGAEIDPLDGLSMTPLMHAIENTQFACAKTLLELGANIEGTDKH